jgi:glycine reductase
MVRELERLGLPTALISPLSSVALSVGANRILRGTAITHPVGQALEMLQLRLEGAQVFEPKVA